MPVDRMQLAITAARKTGDLLRELFQNGSNGGRLKADRTLVTKADRKADQLIQSLIRESCPADGILSEENSTVYPSTQHAWVVDPLDGTVNFSHGLIYWGVSLAHLVDGRPQDAALYFPMVDELYSASAGKGAFLNGQPLSIQEEWDPDLSPIFVHCSRMHQRFAVRTPYNKRSLGAAAYHICLIASSTAVLAVESTPKIWDFAASWLVVEEAGGAVRALGEDQPFPAQPGLDYARKPYPIIAARSSRILEEAALGITPKQS